MARPIAQAPAWKRRTAKQSARNGRPKPLPRITLAPTIDEVQEQERVARKKRWREYPWSVRAVWHVCAFVNWQGRIISWLARRGAHWYPRAHSFVLAHRKAFVADGVLEERLAQCQACMFSYVRRGHRYCRGERGGRGCGCPEWIASRIQYKMQLAAFACPIRRFGPGRTGRLLPGRLNNGG
jgi:hypothetical protein